MYISTTADYTTFKTKYSLSTSLTIDDDTVLETWLVGNEVLSVKLNTSLFFLIGIGAPSTNQDKFKEFMFLKYDTVTHSVIDNNSFICKNSVFSENIDLFNFTFLNYSK